MLINDVMQEGAFIDAYTKQLDSIGQLWGYRKTEFYIWSELSVYVSVTLIGIISCNGSELK